MADDRPTRGHEGTGRDQVTRSENAVSATITIARRVAAASRGCHRVVVLSRPLSRLTALRYGSFGSGGVLFGNMRSLLACSKA
jgi:hypothetical protein